MGLKIASWPYGLGVLVRNTLFNHGWRKINRMSVPVVSVGNLALGGTGKTPCVEYIARFYRDMGLQVAIISRGYGSEVGRNDEALVLEENLPDVPHLQDPDRVAAAMRAVEELESELLIVDDGFQHRRLYRDLDIVLIDAIRPPYRDALFPRGTLRESARSLYRADLVVLTRCDQVQSSDVDQLSTWLKSYAPNTPLVITEHRAIDLLGGTVPEPAENLRGVEVAAFCGIGNPAAFRKTVEQLGAKLMSFRSYPDHHLYTRDDVRELAKWAAPLPLITTQKDWVKLRVSELGGRQLRAVRIGLSVREGHEKFDQLLRRIALVNKDQ